eukprot:scaffold1307_cov200-Pinguiococcus_pyrenoidosus.AAC.58
MPSKSGKRRRSYTNHRWYLACKKFREGKYPTQRAFLRSADSCDDLGESDHVTLFRKLKLYDSGKLKPGDQRKKARKPDFPLIEEKVIRYAQLRKKLYAKDKCGLSWQLLKAKAVSFADALGVESFKASNGWLNRVLKRAGLISIALHGEAMGMSEEDRLEKINAWKVELHQLLEEKDNISPMSPALFSVRDASFASKGLGDLGTSS